MRVIQIKIQTRSLEKAEDGEVRGVVRAGTISSKMKNGSFRDQKVCWEGQWNKTLSHPAGMTLRNSCYQSVRSFEGRDIRVSQSYRVLVGKGLGAVATVHFVCE